jgi:hypothetical protein
VTLFNPLPLFSKIQKKIVNLLQNLVGIKWDLSGRQWVAALVTGSKGSAVLQPEMHLAT